MARRAKQVTPRGKADSPRLTDKQLLFVAEYVQCWNATKAARLAGYSEKTASAIGYENLRKPQIQTAIEAHLKAHSMSAAEALYRLSEMARADMTDFLTENGDIDLVRAREAGKLHLLKRVVRTVTTKGDDVLREQVTIELHDAQSALVQVLNQWRLVSGEAARLDVNVNGGAIPLTIRVVEEDMPPVPSDDAGAEG